MMNPKENKKLQIRNSAAEFLIFTGQAGENTIEVRVEDETVWLTQKLMATLFEVTIPTINHHLSDLYATGEISQKATIRNFLIIQQVGKADSAPAKRQSPHFSSEKRPIQGAFFRPPKTKKPRLWRGSFLGANGRIQNF
jgi:hypothetical protein